MSALLWLAATLSSAPGIEGDWVTADRAALVRIGPCGPTLCGTISGILARGPNVPKTDVNNPRMSLRSHPLVGLQVLSGFVRRGSDWVDGRAYDPKTGRSYKATLDTKSDGTLEVTGCVLFICRSQRWRRP